MFLLPKKVDQSSPKLQMTSYAQMSLIRPNFSALGQTMYEKCYEKRLHLQYFGPKGTPCAKVHQPGDDIQQGPLAVEPCCTSRPARPGKFCPPSENPSTRYLLPKSVDFVDGVTHIETHTHTQETSHRASTTTRWHFVFGTIRICSV